jgi:hypothetical protein
MWVYERKKGDTASYVHPVSTAAEARAAHRRALDWRCHHEPDQSTVKNRCGHFDDNYVAALKGMCR